MIARRLSPALLAPGCSFDSVQASLPYSGSFRALPLYDDRGLERKGPKVSGKDHTESSVLAFPTQAALFVLKWLLLILWNVRNAHKVV